MSTEVELVRAGPDGVTILPDQLVADTGVSDTGFAQPTKDAGARSLLSTLATLVSSVVSTLTGGTARVRVTNGTTNVVVDPLGALRVQQTAQTLFYDSWTGPLDTVTKWTVTGTAPTLSAGDMQMSATPSSYNALQSKDTIRPNAGHTLNRNGVTLEAGTVTGCGRFWGLGTPATTPSPTSLVQNGIGFEVDQTTGALQAVTYASGVKTVVVDNLPHAADGLPHAYELDFRVTSAFWTIDGTIVSSQTFPNIVVVELPALIVRQNAASFVGTPVMRSIAFLTADTSRQMTAIGDPVVGTRMARVTANGQLVASLYADSEPTAFTGTIASGGGTATYTPAAGKAVRLLWASAIADPQASSNPVLSVALGGTEFYRGYAISHREAKTGPVNGTLTITATGGAAAVPFTAHLLEV